MRVSDQGFHKEVQFCWPWPSSFPRGLSFPICDSGMSAWTRGTAGVGGGGWAVLACGVSYGGVAVADGGLGVGWGEPCGVCGPREARPAGP